MLGKHTTLFFALVRRHLAVRYRGSLLGFLWTILNPLLLMATYWLVFKYYIRFDSVQNYTVFLMAGLLPWIWTTSALSEGTSSIVGSAHLITKALFPSHILPLVSVTTAGIHFLLSLPLLIILMLITKATFHVSLLGLLILIPVHAILLSSLSLILALLNVRFRDVQHLLGNILTFLFFLCPIVYPISSVPASFRWTMDYNPAAAIITSYSHLILDGTLPNLQAILVILTFTVFCSLVAIKLYQSSRESLAEHL